MAGGRERRDWDAHRRAKGGSKQDLPVIGSEVEAGSDDRQSETVEEMLNRAERYRHGKSW